MQLKSKATVDADGRGWKGAFFQPKHRMGAEISEYREFMHLKQLM